MTDFFQGLSAIGDTLVKNRERNNRERTLADVGDLLGRGEPDYNAVAARLFAAGDMRSAVLALRLGATRNAGRNRWPAIAPDRTSGSAPSAQPFTLAGDPAPREQFDPEIDPVYVGFPWST